MNHSILSEKAMAYDEPIKNKIVITGISYLHESDREFLKSIGAKWNGNKKAWVLDSSIVTFRQCIDADITCSETLIERYETALESALSKEFKKDDKTIAYKPKTPQFAHQKALMDLYKNTDGRCLFLCGVGTGKSKAAIDCMAMEHTKNKKFLVVTPKRVMTNFKSEIEKHSDLTAIIIQGTSRARRATFKMRAYDVYIINYDILHSMRDDVIRFGFDLVVFDECHYIKSYKSRRTMAALNIVEAKLSSGNDPVTDIVKSIPKRIGMTGTFISNSRVDAFSQSQVIDPSKFGTNVWTFKSRYVVYENGFNGKRKFQREVGTKNDDEFKRILASNSLTFDIDDCVDIPEAIEQKISVDLDSSTMAYYDRVMRSDEAPMNKAMMLQRISSGVGGIEPKSINNNLTIHAENTREKIETLIVTLTAMKSDEKVIVWARFTDTINYISDNLTSEGITNVIFDGRTKDPNVVMDFNNGDDNRVMIAQCSMGAGWEVPIAKVAVFYEMDYSHVNLVQCKGRNRRLKGSEKGSVVYQYLLGKGTIDEKIYDVLLEKDFDAKDALSYVGGVECWRRR